MDQGRNDGKAFREALEELRLLQLSVESWKLLSGRVQAKLDDQEVARFANALRVYATKDRVNEYNHYHLDRLGRPIIQVKAKNVGHGAAAAPDDKAGNLAKQIPICVGAHLMLTSNLWQPVGLCNGARGTVYDMGWAPGADPVQDPPCVIMMEFDKYNGPVFLTTADGRNIVPILPVERDFLIGSTLCTRTQFPLIVCYAITQDYPPASASIPPKDRVSSSLGQWSDQRASQKGGKVSQDDPSTAGARVRLAAIQRDHRSRCRAGETVSLTPTISQLGVFQGSKATEEGMQLRVKIDYGQVGVKVGG
ncbi:hypothetical protein H634G_10985 [Metarhizium anisopliae BRIP 53293]|uniref:DNA helicase Pif1-like 2B domain-containing protein n=1 Tax=Metarhizium anisopliae BRIP 53293 TaxID=1291518 RepID=A0A0D9NIG1_METAN|nr:hypothetical protein H634G_10985 [Metarhizium anisopliae BRIP 53293]